MAIIDVVEWTDPTGEEMVHRFESGEIRLGGQCVVRESQSAVFFRDGKALDVLGPGRHTLTTQNVPLLAGMVNLAFGGESPFKAEIYFVSRKLFPNMKWGTREPVWFRDSEFQMIQLRAFGTYSLQISDPQVFVNVLVGTERRFTTDEIQDFLRSIIVSRLNDLLGETVDTVLNLPKLYDELAGAIKGKVAADFAQYGISMRDFLVESITPPERVQQAMAERASMHAVGDLNDYLKFKAASALDKAAEQPAQGGAMGLGMAAGMGMMIPGMMREARGGGSTFGSTSSADEETGAAGVNTCPHCRRTIPATARFCPECGGKMGGAAAGTCPECGAGLPPGAKFCPACGARQRA